MMRKQTIGKLGIILSAVLWLSACSRESDKVQYKKGLEKLEQQTIQDVSAPDVSGSWDAYYDLWFVSGEEESIDVSETRPLDSQIEERIDLSGYMTSSVIDYISYCSQVEHLFLFSETKYKDEKSNDHHTQLKLVDLKKEEAETIFEFDSDQEIIHDPTLTVNGIYWLVASDTIGVETGSWKLYGMDLEKRETVLLREQEGQNMMPRLRGCEDRIVWIEANENETSYTVYELSGMGEPERLFEIQNITNPYIMMCYTDQILSYIDYYNQSWYVLVYEMDTKELYTYPIRNLEEGEYPTLAVVSKHYITYATYFNRLYAYDRKTGETKQIGNTQYELEGEQDCIV